MVAHHEVVAAAAAIVNVMMMIVVEVEAIRHVATTVDIEAATAATIVAALDMTTIDVAMEVADASATTTAAAALIDTKAADVKKVMLLVVAVAVAVVAAAEVSVAETDAAATTTTELPLQAIVVLILLLHVRSLLVTMPVDEITLVATIVTLVGKRTDKREAQLSPCLLLSPDCENSETRR